ncbi:hypothetical protein RZS28_19575 (plasmid) [Methylocapsa polymorpha]|uniref:Uncharacterized protein n=1 Tax=Methylocapsa polymorpha TaxID=3080828 RepID=A0ABZ0HXS0_9HYPH|nr:hypothetical protein RZS28_19575 [Methylocapsa sp. RX1]
MPEIASVALLSTCAGKSSSTLPATAIGGSHRISSGLKYPKRFQRVERRNSLIVFFKVRWVMSTILIVLLLLLAVAFWLFDELHSG